MNKKYLVGITGNIGSGKSTLLNFLRQKKYNVLSADEQTKFAYAIAKDKLLINFSDVIFDENNEIDRKKLGAIVFSNVDKLKTLNEILHPIIIDLLFSQAAQMDGIVFVEIPLLFECNLQDRFDEIWIVVADFDTKINRIISRDKITYDEAVIRLNSQIGNELNTLQSHIIIDNSGDFLFLENKLNAELIELEKRVEK